MSCQSSNCQHQAQEQLAEGFNAGYSPYLSYSGYPGTQSPSQCGGGSEYGSYGGCGSQIDTHANQYAEHDDAHEHGCGCVKCQVPYSMPYAAQQSSCGNPYCQCDNCDGRCKCGAQEAAMNEGMGGGHMDDKLFDMGLTNGNGFSGHLTAPFLNIHVDFNSVLKYIVAIIAIMAIAHHFLGLRLRR